MQRLCSVPPEDLIAYADGDLEPERRTEIEAHLYSCAVCRERIRSSEEIGRLIRGRFPQQDNPPARAEIMRQVRAIADQRKQPTAMLRFPWLHGVRRWPAAAAGLLLLLAVAIGLPMTTEADFRLGRFINFVNGPNDSAPSILVAGEEPPGTPPSLDNVSSGERGAVSFQAVEPAHLPLDLELVEINTPSEQMLTLVYTDNAGTIVEILQEPAGVSNATFPTSGHVVETVYDTEVLIHRNELGSYGRAIWERDGLIFDILVLRWVGTGPGIQGMVEIAATFIEEQMALESGR